MPYYFCTGEPLGYAALALPKKSGTHPPRHRAASSWGVASTSTPARQPNLASDLFSPAPLVLRYRTPTFVFYVPFHPCCYTATVSSAGLTLPVCFNHFQLVLLRPGPDSSLPSAALPVFVFLVVRCHSSFVTKGRLQRQSPAKGPFHGCPSFSLISNALQHITLLLATVVFFLKYIGVLVTDRD